MIGWVIHVLSATQLLSCGPVWLSRLKGSKLRVCSYDFHLAPLTVYNHSKKEHIYLLEIPRLGTRGGAP